MTNNKTQMIKLKTLLTEANKISPSNNWEIQIMLDHLANHHCVPLIMVDFGCFDRFKKKYNEDHLSFFDLGNKINDYFSDNQNQPPNLKKIIATSFQNFTNEQFKKINELQQDFYITQQSHGSILGYRLSMNEGWEQLRIITLYYYWHQSKEEEEKDQHSKPFYIENFMSSFFCAYSVPLPQLSGNNQKLFLFLGSVLKNNHNINKEKRLKKIDSFWLQLNSLFSITEFNHKLLLSKREFTQLANQFFSCPCKYLETLGSELKKAIELILQINIPNLQNANECYVIDKKHFAPNEGQIILEKRHWIFFTQVIILVMELENKLRGWSLSILHSFTPYEKGQNSGKTHITNLTIDYRKHNFEFGENIQLNNLQKFEKQLCYIQPVNKWKKLQQKITMSDTLKKNLEQQIDLRYHQIINAINQRIDANMNQRILVLQNHITLDFNKVAENFSETNLNDQHLSKICTWINSISRADCTSIYTYNYVANNTTEKSSIATCYPPKYKENVTKILNEILTRAIKKSGNSNLQLRQTLKKEAIIYRAMIDSEIHETKINLGNIVEPTDGKFHQTFGDDSSVHSAIAYPMLFKKRVIGCIEIMCRKPYAFGFINGNSLRQISITLGQYYYFQKYYYPSMSELNQLIIEGFEEWSSALQRRELIEGIYNKICEQINQLLISSAAGLWLCSSKDNQNYELMGFYGSKKMQTLILDEPNYVTIETGSNKKSLEAGFIKTSKELWQQQNHTIQSSKRHTSILKEEELNHITFIRLNQPSLTSSTEEVEDSNIPLGFITIHNRHNDESDKNLYSPSWDDNIKNISLHISRCLKIIQTLLKKGLIDEQLLRHEIRTEAGMILDRANYALAKDCTQLRNWVNFNKYNGGSNWQSLKDLSTNLEIHQKDLSKKAENISQMIRLWSNKREGSAITDIDGVIVSQITQNKNTSPPLFFTEQFNSASRTNYYKWSQKNIRVSELKYTNSPLGKKLRLRMMEDHFNRIMNNLLENALKYSIINSNVEVEIQVRPKLVNIIIKNISKPLDVQEIHNTTEKGWRGNNNSEVDGEGMGLYIVKKCLTIYNIGFNYVCIPIPHNSNIAIHQVTLSIPDSIFQWL